MGVLTVATVVVVLLPPLLLPLLLLLLLFVLLLLMLQHKYTYTLLSTTPMVESARQLACAVVRHLALPRRHAALLQVLTCCARVSVMACIHIGLVALFSPVVEVLQ